MLFRDTTNIHDSQLSSISILPGDGVPQSTTFIIFIREELHVLLAGLLGYPELDNVRLEASHHYLHVF